AGRHPRGEAPGLTRHRPDPPVHPPPPPVPPPPASGLVRDGLVAGCYRRAAWEALRCGRPAHLWDTAAHTP
ncbi:hypothetical protein ACFVZX_21645, partial [Streptomyces erythrochromogenes]